MAAQAQKKNTELFDRFDAANTRCLEEIGGS
jgi:hypothetical protein